MKFIEADDSSEDQMYSRVVSENNLVEVGIYPVMFGFRVRCGFVGSKSYFIDYCGGADQLQVETLYSMTIAILSQRDENREVFKGLPPCSNIKPYFNDVEFLEWIINESKPNYTHISLPPLSTIKEKQMKVLFNDKT